MSKEEFVNIIINKINEVLTLRTENQAEIKFYLSCEGKYPEDEIKVYEKELYVDLVIGELKSILLMPIYERIMNASSMELENYRTERIKTTEGFISMFKSSNAKLEEEIKMIEHEIEQELYKSYGMLDDFTRDYIYKKKDRIVELRGLIKNQNYRISCAEKYIEAYKKYSYEELKNVIIKDFRLESLNEKYLKNISTDIDRIMVRLADKPEVVKLLLTYLDEYETSRATTISEKISLEDLFAEDCSVITKESVLKGTETARVDENGNLIVLTSKDMGVIKENISSIITEGKIIGKRIIALRDTVVNMSQIYDNIFEGDLSDFDIESLSKMFDEVYGEFYKFGFEPKLLSVLRENVDKYNKLSKKMIKTNSDKKEMKEAGLCVKGVISKIYYDMIIKVCKEIKWFKETIGYLEPTGILPLDLDEIDMYNLSYSSINNVPAFHAFFNDYLKLVNHLCNNILPEVVNECDVAIQRMSSDEELRERNIKNATEKVQICLNEVCGGEYKINLCCLEPLSKALRTEHGFAYARANVKTQETMDEFRRMGTVENLAESPDLFEDLAYVINKVSNSEAENRLNNSEAVFSMKSVLKK